MLFSVITIKFQQGFFELSELNYVFHKFSKLLFLSFFSQFLIFFRSV